MSMLNTTGDIKTEVLVRTNISTTLTFITDEMLNDWLDQAHQFTVGYKRWPFAEGRVSTTIASFVTNEDSDLVGEYPEGWKADSIRILLIGGKRLQKLNFEDFRIYREEQDDGTDKIYSDFARRLYVNPNTGLSGTLTVWGRYTPAAFDSSDPTVITLFSNNEPDGNEAIVEEIISYEKLREKKEKESITHHEKAVAILDGIWERVKNEQFGYQTKNRGMFKRIDILEGATRDEIIKRDQFY